MPDYTRDSHGAAEKKIRAVELNYFFTLTPRAAETCVAAPNLGRALEHDHATRHTRQREATPRACGANGVGHTEQGWAASDRHSCRRSRLCWRAGNMLPGTWKEAMGGSLVLES
jgi:hypothetical protein